MSEPQAMAGTVATELPGTLGAAVTELGERARLHDLYDDRGSRVYDDSAQVDLSEIRALRRILREHSGPVLELAAGSGRLTVPMLRMGYEVTALEYSPSMIERLHENAAQLPDSARDLLRVHQGDMSDFELNTRFPVIVLLAGSISLLDDEGRADTFRAVARHLSPGGVLLFSIVAEDEGDSGPVDRTSEVEGRSGQLYRVHEFREAGAMVRRVGVYPVLDEPGAAVPVCVSTHHVLDPAPVLQAVERAGLTVRRTTTAETAQQGLTEVFVEAGDRP